MDTLWIAATGARAVLRQQAVTTNNLANVNTTGYRGEQAQFRALPVYGNALPTSAYTTVQGNSANLQEGPINHTGRNLDVAIRGSGWIAVQAPNGDTAYTRNGDLQVSASGILSTSDGRPVLGQSGAPISVPPLESVQIGADGTISGVPVGSQPNALVVINRIQLVNPPPAQMQRGADGLFRDTQGPAPADGNVQLAVGALEGSNVNPVQAMIQILDNTRAFEMQTKLMQTVDQNHQAATQLLNVS
ncbi:MAG: flagellar basal-body rod protein FlgF [Thiomonas sp. 14-64-326]|jgi:flagellar basal-body rod protein FlgF|uniref:Flagellar basal-body rod protein FlgF n=1 Tax=Thiomonas intermedia (strain K12) TaxID=75379 RepID=D5X0D8_THIK1|nr:flagellar basal-body rod protein FlgF [Thiomonas sp.]OZB73589.1 MAG: flagellar basal-body rod protein FlgF [Thiomonas sp. 14-64-326]